MLKKIFKNIGLRFTKKERIKVILGLALNALLLAKWRAYKLFHGIHQPVVHYYTVCWNEEKMLPFMFQHYHTMVSQYFIYDNESTDSSQQIVKTHPNAQVIPFVTDGFNDEIQNTIKNECWKASRGKADYVIVCDLDEFFYLPDVEKFWNQVAENAISLPLPKGYDMCSSEFPKYSAAQSLVDQVKTGRYSKKYSKCIFFDPYKIVDINYEPGAHFCHPTGIVRSIEYPLYSVLHYHNLGADYVIDRARKYRLRMSRENIEKGYAKEYMVEEEIKNNITQMMHDVQQVIE